MVGGDDEPWSSPPRGHTPDAQEDEAAARRLREPLSRVRLEVAYAWAGVFGTTPDGLPCIGTIPEHPHTFFALGYGGNGITFGVVAAELVRDWWTGRPNPDAALFAFDR